jgi:uncharacterized protein (TIGR03435 family)
MQRKTLFICSFSLVAQVVYATAAAAQMPAAAPPQTFDVASIRPSSRDPQIPRIRIRPGGRVETIYSTLREIIRWAFALDYFDPIEGDSRMLDQRFDIVAIAANSLSPQTDIVEAHQLRQYKSMAQRLLADRFGLAVHREQQHVPGYALVMARSDRRLGPSLRPSPIDCAALRTRVAAGDEQALAAVASPTPGEPGPCNIWGRDNRTRAGGHTMAEFANFLSTIVLRMPIEDRTGLKGPFAIDMTHAPALSIAPSPPGGDGPPSLTTALREQLGLTLERIDATVEALIVDRVGPLVVN